MPNFFRQFKLEGTTSKLDEERGSEYSSGDDERMSFLGGINSNRYGPRGLKIYTYRFLSRYNIFFKVVFFLVAIWATKLLADLRIDHNSKKLSNNWINSTIDFPFEVGCRIPDVDQERANAALVMLARNSELNDVIKSIKSLERHFNQWFHYPWVFLNDVPFDEKFMETVKEYTVSDVEFGVITPQQWEFQNEDPDLMREYIESQGDREILYGNSESYHKMCRFYSGSFFKHELVKKRDWYWRVEPDVEFYCDITYDPFVEMDKHNKKYGFVVMVEELEGTVPTLFKETKTFIKNNNIKVGDLWHVLTRDFNYAVGKDSHDYEMKFTKEDVLKEMVLNLSIEDFLELKDKKDEDLDKYDQDVINTIIHRSTQPPLFHPSRVEGEEYNLCHFWTNFEIARTDLFNSQLYEKYFDHLDKSGGFYRERWGDAPVHSLALGMMLNKEDVHYFRDIGYKHSELVHCPKNAKLKQIPYSPAARYFDKPSAKGFLATWPSKNSPNGVGCRCRCPLYDDMEDVTSCSRFWAEFIRDDYKKPNKLDLDQAIPHVHTKLRKLYKDHKLGMGLVDKIQ